MLRICLFSRDSRYLAHSFTVRRISVKMSKERNAYLDLFRTVVSRRHGRWLVRFREYYRHRRCTCTRPDRLCDARNRTRCRTCGRKKQKKKIEKSPEKNPSDRERRSTIRFTAIIVVTIILPGDDLDESAGLRNARFRVEHAGEGRAIEVRRHAVLLGVSQHILQPSLGCLPHRLLHTFVRGRLVDPEARHGIDACLLRRAQRYSRSRI